MLQKKGGHLSLFFPFQNNASKTLLAIMESRHDTENAERILYNMTPQQLVRCCQITELESSTKVLAHLATFAITDVSPFLPI